MPFTAPGGTGARGFGGFVAFIGGAPGCGVRTGGPFLHGTGPRIRFVSVSLGITMGLGVRFPLAPAAPIAGFTVPLACPAPPGVALLPGWVPIPAFTGPEAAATGRSTIAASAGKDGFERGQNETMSHTTDPIAKDAPTIRIASRSPVRLLTGEVCMGATF